MQHRALVRSAPAVDPLQELLDRAGELHETKTVLVINKYNQLHGMVEVDGMGSFEEVFARTSGGLESIFRTGVFRPS